MKCVLVASSLTAQVCDVIIVHIKRVCHPVSHVISSLVFHIFSLPVHHNTKHNLDSMNFSKTTLYTEHLFQNLYSRQSSVEEPLSQVIYESGGIPRTNTPTGYGLRQFLEVLWKRSIKYTMYREFGEQDQHAPIIEKEKEFGVFQFIQTQSLLDHEMAETSPDEKMSQPPVPNALRRVYGKHCGL